MCDPNEVRHPPLQTSPQYLNSGGTGGGNGVGGPPPSQGGGAGAGSYDDYRGGNSSGYRGDYDDGYRQDYGGPNCPPGSQSGGPQNSGPTGGPSGGNVGGNQNSGGVGSSASAQSGGSGGSGLGYDTSYYDHEYNDEYGYEDRDGYRKDPGYRDRDRDRSHRADRRIHDRRRGRPMDRPRRDRDRDRDRDRGFDRDRDRSRSRDGRDRKERNPRDRSDRYEEGFDCDSSSRDSGESFRRELREDRAGERWMTDTPTHTILLRGLRYHIEEKDILAELMSIGLSVKDVRLMRKSSGASRGFAFVEFQNVADAQRWMEQNQGSLYLQDMFSVTMHYSQPKTGPEKAQKSDWVCSKCGAHNFKRRDFCFKCSVSREESERAKEGDGFDQVGTNPCNTLIFRGLDALTTEETLSQALSQQTSLTVKNIKIIRDELTNTSRGYGFAEMSSILESTQVLEHLQQINPPFEVDGKLILVAFAKNTFSTVMTTLSSRPSAYAGNQMQQRSWNYDQQQGDYYYNQSGYEHSTYYDQTSPYYGQAQNYDSNYYNNQNFSQQADSTNAAAAVAQAAIQQAQAAKQYQKHYQKQVQEQQKLAEMSPEERLAHQAQNWSQQKNLSPSSSQSPQSSTAVVSASAVTVGAPTTVESKADATKPATIAAAAATTLTAGDSPTRKGTSSIPKQQSSAQQAFSTPTGMPVNDEYPKYPSPDVCTYQYDESSGYYYDPSTGLYYDANSQYYYNASTCQFLYWDAEKSTYLPAPTTAQGQLVEDQRGDNDQRGKKKEDKKEKVKIAKKIAKDMEKWAKTLNAQKEAIKEGYKKVVVSPTGVLTPVKRGFEERESAAADAGYAILEKTCSGRGLEDKRLMPPPSPMSTVEKTAALASSPSMTPSAAAAAAAAAAASNPALVASYGGDSDSDDEQFEQSPQPGVSQRTGLVDEAKLTDWAKLACLLCKRQFPSKEALTRHTQLSDLHKQNLEVLKKKFGSGGPDGDKKGPYRDRAKERREKYGAPSPPEPRRKFEAPVNYEEPTKQGIGNDNIGNKLLQKMGWSEGQGLGKQGQGIVAPIQAQRRSVSAGLGVRGANIVSDAGDSYKTAVKKTMFARYHELE